MSKLGKMVSTLLCLLALTAMSTVVNAVTSNRAAETAPPVDAGYKISVTAKCINQMKAYRVAIGFIANRLEKSPPALIYVSEDGQALTLHNRIHRTMQYERRVLEAGMQARARTCTKALMS
ncbi:hypothetical protein [Kordiimonas sp.]|uniref:hypothetical protein n=1 Tax=Kordiimonas sp. TaxID=1970157 RepID=UPI003A8D22B8